MSRRDAVKPSLNLSEKIDEYKSLKDEESAVKKALKPLGDEIKEALINTDSKEFSSEQWTAKISVKENVDFNELKAIEILKEKLSRKDLATVVKTKEYIDDDALESLVYLGKFDITELSVCNTIKEPTVTLRISKKK